MSWNREFISQDYGRPIYKHKELPVYITDEFDFFRCVEFKDDFYRKTASSLFNDNLRECTGRYSNLFPNQRLSYWADSAATARAEIKKHGAGNNILTFWAYDDGTSTFPTLPDQSPLVIIDGRRCVGALFGGIFLSDFRPDALLYKCLRKCERGVPAGGIGRTVKAGVYFRVAAGIRQTVGNGVAPQPDRHPQYGLRKCHERGAVCKME